MTQLSRSGEHLANMKKAKSKPQTEDDSAVSAALCKSLSLAPCILESSSLNVSFKQPSSAFSLATAKRFKRSRRYPLFFPFPADIRTKATVKLPYTGFYERV